MYVKKWTNEQTLCVMKYLYFSFHILCPGVELWLMDALMGLADGLFIWKLLITTGLKLCYNYSQMLCINLDFLAMLEVVGVENSKCRCSSMYDWSSRSWTWQFYCGKISIQSENWKMARCIHSCTYLFLNHLFSTEYEFLLNIENEIHMFCLHYVPPKN